MCHYITATLPGTSSLQVIAAIFEEHRLGFERILNPHVRRQIEPGDIQIRRIGLLVHVYSRRIESERITIPGVERVKLSALNPELLMKMKEDVLYEFV